MEHYLNKSIFYILGWVIRRFEQTFEVSAFEDLLDGWPLIEDAVKDFIDIGLYLGVMVHGQDNISQNREEISLKDVRDAVLVDGHICE